MVALLWVGGPEGFDPPARGSARGLDQPRNRGDPSLVIPDGPVLRAGAGGHHILPAGASCRHEGGHDVEHSRLLGRKVLHLTPRGRGVNGNAIGVPYEHARRASYSRNRAVMSL